MLVAWRIFLELHIEYRGITLNAGDGLHKRSKQWSQIQVRAQLEGFVMSSFGSSFIWVSEYHLFTSYSDENVNTMSPVDM